MDKSIIELDESQVREVIQVPVVNLGCWNFTMEACALCGELEKAVRPVFAAFPKVVRQALTFTPESGGWAGRARFWDTVLRLALPPKQYHQALQRLLRSYKRAAGIRNQQPQQEGEKKFEEEAGPFFLECYRLGASRGNRPFEQDFEAEARAMSLRTSIPLEQVMESHVLRLLFQMGNDAYEQGAKLRAAHVQGRI